MKWRRVQGAGVDKQGDFPAVYRLRGERGPPMVGISTRTTNKVCPVN